MMEYLRSRRFRNHAGDWTIAFVALVYFFFVAEKAGPFQRQFKLSDPNIQHPFAYHERVTGIMCLVLAAGVPTATMVGFSAVFSASRRWKWDKTVHLVQVSVLGLVICLTADGIFTDILKNWIGRPRPDFLARCGPKKGTPYDVFVDISVCTAPLGELALKDGMRLTPLGHLSISYSCFLYLTLWLFGQLRLLVPKAVASAQVPLYKYLGACLPLLLATYVALSRPQDYRHHFSDIGMGAVIGLAFGVVLYRRFFRLVFSEHSDVPNDTETEDTVLPLHIGPE